MSQGSGEVRRLPTDEHRRVVIVEDDPDSLAELNLLITSFGFEAIPFSDFPPARRFLAEERPHALLVDVRLGEYNGLHLVLFAKPRDPQLIAVVISGYDDPVIQAEALAAGATYLRKPIDIDALHALLLHD